MAMKKRFYSVNGQMMGYEEGGVKKDFLTDHLGSITAEIDQSQTRTYDTRYSAYGRNNWSTGTGCGFGWVGSYGYRETGLFHMSHYVRARHYSLVTGNWSTVDPLWPDEASYGYVGGNPISRIDYFGENWACIGCAGCLGAAAAACYDCGLDSRCWVDCLVGIYENLPPIIADLCTNACLSCLGGLLRGIPKGGGKRGGGGGGGPKGSGPNERGFIGKGGGRGGGKGGGKGGSKYACGCTVACVGDVSKGCGIFVPAGAVVVFAKSSQQAHELGREACQQFRSLATCPDCCEPKHPNAKCVKSPI